MNRPMIKKLMYLKYFKKMKFVKIISIKFLINLNLNNIT